MLMWKPKFYFKIEEFLQFNTSVYVCLLQMKPDLENRAKEGDVINKICKKHGNSPQLSL